MVAIMLVAMDIKPGMKVLEIGTGSGYNACLIAELVRPGKVYSVERVPELAGTARSMIDRLGYGDVVKVLIGDGSEGLEGYAPYDRIVVTAAAPDVPQRMLDQLSENGTLLIPSGEREVQELLLFVKHGNKIERHDLGDVMFVPLIGRSGYNGQ